jgi:hypothetical protein
LRSVVRLSVRFRCCKIALISGLPCFKAWMRGREYFPSSKSEQKPWSLVFYSISAIFAENADGGVVSNLRRLEILVIVPDLYIPSK